MMPGQTDKLLDLLARWRADANQNAATAAANLVHLQQEIFVLRKVLELLLPPEKAQELQAFLGQRRAPAPAPDLSFQSVQALPTQAEIDEINRALNTNELEVGMHGLPVSRPVGFGG